MTGLVRITVQKTLPAEKKFNLRDEQEECRLNLNAVTFDVTAVIRLCGPQCITGLNRQCWASWSA